MHWVVELLTNTIFLGAVGWITTTIASQVLQRQAFEYEVKYRRVDEKVAHHLAETYRHLNRLFAAVESYVRIGGWSGEPSKDEKLAVVQETNKAFGDAFFPNRPYIPPQLYKRTKQVYDRLVDITRDFTRGRERNEHGTPDPWVEAFDAIRNEANPLFDDLVAAYQKRLGVVDEPD